MHKNIAVLILLFLLDRLIKNVMWFSPRIPVAGFLHPVLNNNIAFSLQLPGLSGVLLTALLALIVLGFFIAVTYFYRKHDRMAFWWALIAIGALSNVLDRFTLGGVLDYIDISWFPVFNLSDTYITIGVVALLYQELLRNKRSASSIE